MEQVSESLDLIARQVVDAAYQVHVALGPGLLESVYEECLAHELNLRGIKVARQVALPAVYKGKKLEAGFRVDLLVEDELVVEIKAVELMNPVFTAQVMTYLKLSEKRLGFLINFNVPKIREGIKRIVI